MNAVLRLQRFAATYSRSLVAYAIVAILWIAASLLIGGFGAYAHLRYIVELAAVIGLVGIGQTIAVIGGGIDLSVSAVITVTAIILPLVTFDADATGLGAIALALLVAAAIGAVNGLGIGYLGLPPLIMTLAMATILQGLLILIAGGSAISVTNPSLDWLGSTHVSPSRSASCYGRSWRRFACSGCMERAAVRSSSPSAPIRWSAVCRACRFAD